MTYTTLMKLCEKGIKGVHWYSPPETKEMALKYVDLAIRKYHSQFKGWSYQFSKNMNKQLKKYYRRKISH